MGDKETYLRMWERQQPKTRSAIEKATALQYLCRAASNQEIDYDECEEMFRGLDRMIDSLIADLCETDGIAHGLAKCLSGNGEEQEPTGEEAEDIDDGKTVNTRPEVANRDMLEIAQIILKEAKPELRYRLMEATTTVWAEHHKETPTDQATSQ